ncbi:cytochrome o ubiquinol oxidase subunit III [Salinisphaera sp. USBA-960]|uniref:cytochrome o ubiquinol oxidase subunit III n=1 Tax=Salinisphaera orenii TaxID=856731 RepID=UPI000DBE7F4C|nr:cytochrome o ubiquinol oxidase subunit III [Salifodinibacter halophilus]NNC27083.1 cytochrome o ubiquinol oxidase subunit III [Salifodinibacter halophilus]
MATTDAAAHDGIRAEASQGTVVNFGFWLYLMSDVIIFSMLFVAFVNLSTNYAQGPTGQELFELPLVFIETMALLISSLTYGLVMICLRQGNTKWVQGWLLITFLLGVGFVGLELYEFLHLAFEGYGPQRSAFLSSFFTLVGTHGTHVTFGLIWILVMVGQVAYKGLTPAVASRLTRLSLFWHFLDIVWIAVFSTVYLGGMYR